MSLMNRTAEPARRPATAQPAQARQRQMLILGGIVAAAVLIFGVAIALSGQGSPAASIDFTSQPTTRTSDGAYVFGDPDAPITLVEFADYGCPHCQTYHPTISQFIAENVVTGKARFEYRIFPTAGGQLSAFTGALTYCAAEEDPANFWLAYQTFFDLAGDNLYNDDVGRRAAERMGMSYSQLLECTADNNNVQTDVTFGRNRGVEATPALRVRFGDGDAQVITWNGVSYNRSTVPLNVLNELVASVQPSA